MGWEIPWYTITDDFDVDFGVDEWHGTYAFLRDTDEIFLTYFVNNRGDEAMGSTPEGYPQAPPYKWWNLHDQYDQATILESSRS